MGRNKKINTISKKLPKFTMVHVPKTGGNTFRKTIIHPLYGSKHKNEHKDRFNINKDFAYKKFTYDFHYPPGVEKYDVISGHFMASKYKHLNRPIVAWVRNPVNRAISHYYDWQWHMRDKQTRAPIPQSEYNKLVWLEYFEAGMDLVEFSEVFGNYMSFYFDIPLEQFAFIGVLEKYNKSLTKFENIFNLKVPRTDKRFNTRRKRNISDDIKSKMAKHHEKDFELYNKILEDGFKESFMENSVDEK